MACMYWTQSNVFVATEGCHASYSRESVGTFYCTYGESNTTNVPGNSLSRVRFYARSFALSSWFMFYHCISFICSILCYNCPCYKAYKTTNLWFLVYSDTCCYFWYHEMVLHWMIILLRNQRIFVICCEGKYSYSWLICPNGIIIWKFYIVTI